MTNPYAEAGPEAFWRTAVAETGPFALSGLWTPKFQIRQDDRIATFGSCFAQHFSRALAARDYRWIDCEPAPPFLPEETCSELNYGVFSARTCNIYTVNMLGQWLDMACGVTEPPDEVWVDANGRFRDPLRPLIEPDGFDDRKALFAARAATLAAIRDAIEQADVFVFTLGLTESWANRRTGLEYAICPGTVAGTFDPDTHVFRNPTTGMLAKRLRRVLRLLRQQNPDIQVLLTVSPVPLTATAAQGHVLTQTTYSKSALRAVAGEAANEMEFVDYFPSYEIITHPVFRGMFFAPNMRSVVPQGIDTVMSHFFADQARVFGATNRSTQQAAKDTSATELHCEEEMLNAFA